MNNSEQADGRLNVGSQIEGVARLSRFTVQHQSEWDDARRTEKLSDVGAAVAVNTVVTPSAHQAVSVRSDIDNGVVIGAATWRFGLQHHLRIRGPDVEQIDDVETAEAPSPGPAVTTTHGWIVSVLIGGAGIEHQEAQARQSRVPLAPKPRPIGTARGKGSPPLLLLLDRKLETHRAITGPHAAQADGSWASRLRRADQRPLACSISKTPPTSGITD